MARIDLGLSPGAEASAVAVGASGAWVSVTAQPAGWVFRVDPKTEQVASRTAIGFAPGQMAIVGSGVWVTETVGDASPAEAGLRQNLVTQIAAADGSASDSFRVTAPQGLVYVNPPSTLWVSESGGAESTISGLNLPTGTARGHATFLGSGMTRLVQAAGLVWGCLTLVSPSGVASYQLVGVDPATAIERKEFRLGSVPVYDLAAGDDSLVLLRASDRPGFAVAEELDAGTGRVVVRSTQFPVVTSIAVDHGRVWLLSNDQLVGLDEESLAPIDGPVTIPGATNLAAYGDVWLTAGGSLIRIRPN